MTFPHSHTHSRTILGFLGGFSANNLCFLVFSSLCSRSVYYLSIAFSHSATLSEYALTQRHTVAPLWLDRLPRTTKNLVLSFVIYYCRWSHHFMTSLPFSPSSPCVCYIYSDFYHFLSFPGLSASFGVYVYSDASPSPTPTPPVSPSAPACPAFVTGLVSITTATFLSCLTIFNQKRRKTEME